MRGVFFKSFQLLSSGERKSSVKLLLMIVLGVCFEILGIGILVPVIVLLMENDLVAKYPELAQLHALLGYPNHDDQVKMVLIFLVFIYAVKNGYLAFLAWYQAKFSVGLQVQLSKKLFAIYLTQPYYFHLQRNSAHLIRNIGGEISQFVGHAINPFLMVFAELLVVVSILGLLIFVEPLASLSVCILLATAAFLFHYVTRKRISKWGGERVYHDGLRIQQLQQGLNGVKDVKLMGREADFLAEYDLHNSSSGRILQLLEVVQKLPRLWFEFLAVVGFVVLVLVMLTSAQNTSDLVPMLGLFSAAAFRLMPSMSRILNAVQSLRFGLPAVELLFSEFQLSSAQPTVVGHSKQEKIKNEIKVAQVTYAYPASEKVALQKISVNIKQGESIGIIGPSGSGKSTLMDLILGLLLPDTGSVEVDGKNIQTDIRGWQNQIGYVPQSIYLTDDTLRRNIAFGITAEDIDEAAVQRAIKLSQLSEFIDQLPEGIDTEVGERGVRLSGGQRQRVGIARALYHEPQVLVLDEATSALDNKTEENVMDGVMALHGDKTIIIVAHRLTTVKHCDRIYRLDNGMVVEEGSPAEIIPSTNISS